MNWTLYLDIDDAVPCRTSSWNVSAVWRIQTDTSVRCWTRCCIPPTHRTADTPFLLLLLLSSPQPPNSHTPAQTDSKRKVTAIPDKASKVSPSLYSSPPSFTCDNPAAVCDVREHLLALYWDSLTVLRTIWIGWSPVCPRSTWLLCRQGTGNGELRCTCERLRCWNLVSVYGRIWGS